MHGGKVERVENRLWNASRVVNKSVDEKTSPEQPRAVFAHISTCFITITICIYKLFNT